MDLKYLSGFFDGSGSVHIRKIGNQYRLLVNIGQKDKVFLEILKRQFGGNIYKQTSTKYSDNYFWQVNGKKAGLFLRKIVEFSILKTEEIEEGIKFSTTISSQCKKGTPLEIKARREFIWKRLKELKKKGDLN